MQPWGRDGDKRRYFLIEGQDDTSFRIYRENHRYTRNAQWYNMGGNIEEIRVLAERLDKEDGTQAARTLGGRIVNAIGRFEQGEEVGLRSGTQFLAIYIHADTNPQKRRRREYRQARRAAFTRPEPGFSLYEGRTRGKRARYTYDEDDYDDTFSDATTNRRSNRQSGRSTPADIGPQYTNSGRQVRPRQGGEYGASLLSTQAASPDELGPGYSDDRDASDSEQPVRGGARAARATRGVVNGGSRLKKRKRISDDDDDEGSLDDLSDDAPSGEEWDSQANDDADDAMPDADDESDELDEEEEDYAEPKSLVITLKTSSKPQRNGEASAPPSSDAQNADDSTAAGATKAEPSTSGLVDGLHTASTSLHPPEAEPKQTEYPTPTSTIAGVDKSLLGMAAKPQSSTFHQASEEKPADGAPTTEA